MAAYFSIILTLATLITGLVWLLDRFVLAPKRQANLAEVTAKTNKLEDEVAHKILQEPYLVENSKSVFPVLLIVLVLRSFLYEPFQIPSGSMMPTLLVGDFILVEKYAYGLKDPVWQKKIVETGKPKRGDIAVFKYPLNTKIDYIKRIIGLPGDKIFYRNKTLYIQEACKEGQQPCPELKQIAKTEESLGAHQYDGQVLDLYSEQLGDVKHNIYINPETPEQTQLYHVGEGMKVGEYVVPEGHYFAMGDNRDNSADGRFWGFVPEENLVGKAVFIWVSFEFDRKESDWIPRWIPSGIRFDRIGGIE